MPGAGHLREGESLNTVRVDVDGLGLRVRDSGNPRSCAAGRGGAGGADPTPLLLLNGLASPLDTWEPLLARLAPTRRVLAFDAPGVGGSDTPPLPITVRRLAEIAARVASERGAAVVDVLGYSHGGIVAQQLAIDRPERVRRLVLAATSWGVGAVPGHPLALAAAAGRAALLANPLAGHRVGLGLAWQLAAVASWSCLPWLHRIRAATLVVTGTKDLVVPAVNARLLAARIPDSELVVLPDAGHELFRGDALAALLPPLTRFLERGTTAAIAHQASA